MTAEANPPISPSSSSGKLIKRLEDGEPFTPAPYQRRVLEMLLRGDPSGALAFRLVLLSDPKIHWRISPSSRAFRWQVSDAFASAVNKFDAMEKGQAPEGA